MSGGRQKVLDLECVIVRPQPQPQVFGYELKQKSSVIVFPLMCRKGDNVSWAGE